MTTQHKSSSISRRARFFRFFERAHLRLSLRTAAWLTTFCFAVVLVPTPCKHLPSPCEQSLSQSRLCTSRWHSMVRLWCPTFQYFHVRLCSNPTTCRSQGPGYCCPQVIESSPLLIEWTKSNTTLDPERVDAITRAHACLRRM